MTDFCVDMHIVIYGPEGSGKGTQAKKLAEKFQIPLYTSGDLVREAAKERNDKLGKACLQALKEGKYADDAVMFKLWEDKLKCEEAKTGFIMDGFPRNINQAIFLFTTLEKIGYGIDKVIYLDISDKESVGRLIKRKRMLFEGSNIKHDSLDRITERLKSFKEGEKRLLPYFESKGILVMVEGAGAIEEVFKRIIGRINAALQ